METLNTAVTCNAWISSCCKYTTLPEKRPERDITVVVLKQADKNTSL
jgi:hypothetical protein